jgi:hypothetical protein
MRHVLANNAAKIVVRPSDKNQGFAMHAASSTESGNGCCQVRKTLENAKRNVPKQRIPRKRG